MSVMMVPFSDRINEYLSTYDLTQIAFSGRIGYSKQTVNSWCSGKSTPNLNDLPDIAHKMMVSLPWLMGYPNLPMLNGGDGKVEEIIDTQAGGVQKMDSDEKQFYNGSLNPTYTPSQMDLRMAMLNDAIQLYKNNAISEETLKLLVNSLR